MNPKTIKRRVFAMLFLLFLTTALQAQKKSTVQKYTDSINRNPNKVEFYESRGFAYYGDKKYDFAITDYSQALKLNPKSVEAYKWRGMAYHEINNYDLAIKDYTNALSIEPNNLSLYKFRAFNYTKLKQYDLAIQDYSTIIKLGKDAKVYIPDAMTQIQFAYSFRGSIYKNLGRYDLAIADFTRNILEYPNSAIDLWDRGDCYFYIEEYDLAINDCKAALKILPNNKEIKENLTLAISKKEKLTKEKGGVRSYQIDSNNSYNTVIVSKGDIILITASGSVMFGAFAGSGDVNGIDGFTDYNRVDGFRHGALLVRVGDEGKWEAVGTSKEIIADADGFLKFIVNDRDPSNNSGAFIVEIVKKNNTSEKVNAPIPIKYFFIHNYLINSYFEGYFIKYMILSVTNSLLINYTLSKYISRIGAKVNLKANSSEIVWTDSKLGYFTDTRDNRKYKVIKIGAQVWMAENLAYKTSSGSLAYNNELGNVAKYGYLYTWETAQKICPNGWRLPVEKELINLLLPFGKISYAGEDVNYKKVFGQYEPEKTNSTYLQMVNDKFLNIPDLDAEKFDDIRTMLWSSSHKNQRAFAIYWRKKNTYVSYNTVHFSDYPKTLFGFCRCVKN